MIISYQVTKPPPPPMLNTILWEFYTMTDFNYDI